MYTLLKVNIIINYGGIYKEGTEKRIKLKNILK